MNRYRYRDLEGTLGAVTLYARRRISGLKQRVEEQEATIARQSEDIHDLVRLLTAREANFAEVCAMLKDAIRVIKELTRERNELRERPRWHEFSRN